MRKAACGACGVEQPVAEMLAQDRKIFCHPCAEKRFTEAKAAGQSLQFARILDPTICSICHTDYGSSDLPFIGGSAVCGNCSPKLYAYPLPAWLKLSAVGLLFLLGFALWRGTPYFKAGRHLVLAERAMDRKDYQQARTEFAEVLKVSPQEQRVLLLSAKACLLSGDLLGADAPLKLRKEYESNDLFNEVKGLLKRATGAYEKAAQASKLLEAHRDDEAVALMQQASNEYPESADLAVAALYYKAGAAFDRKDYDGFLEFSTAVMQKSPDSSSTVAGVASALAAKYASTGNPEFRARSEEMLAKAQALSQTPEDKANFQEYAERIRYRLDTREIIDKDEYDRRFSQKKEKP